MTRGASLMKQEYLQVQRKSGVKQSSGFGACAINTRNNIIDKGFLKEIELVLQGQVYFI